MSSPATGWTDAQHIGLVADAGCTHPPLYYDDRNNRTIQGRCRRCEILKHERHPEFFGKRADIPPVAPGERVLDDDAFFALAGPLIADLTVDGTDQRHEKLIAALRALDTLERRGIVGTRRGADDEIAYVLLTESAVA